MDTASRRTLLLGESNFLYALTEPMVDNISILIVGIGVRSAINKEDNMDLIARYGT
jgi:hypothetical protein